MLRIFEVFGLATLLSFLPHPVGQARGGDSDASMGRAAELAKAIQEKAAPSWEVGDLGRAFGDLSEAEVAALKQHKNKAVALRAAWEQQRRLLRRASQGTREEPSSWRVNRFLGFLEGRLRVTIPTTWEKRLAKVHLRSDGTVTFPASAQPALSEGLNTATVSLSEFNGKPGPELVIDGRSFALPSQIAEKLKEAGAEHVTILLQEGMCLALAYSDAAPIRLIRYDIKAREIVWESSIWGIGQGLFGGISQHSATIACGAENVLVFGVTGLGAYVECFALADGAALVRFATNDWCNEGGVLPVGARKKGGGR